MDKIITTTEREVENQNTTVEGLKQQSLLSSNYFNKNSNNISLRNNQNIMYTESFENNTFFLN